MRLNWFMIIIIICITSGIHAEEYVLAINFNETAADDWEIVTDNYYTKSFDTEIKMVDVSGKPMMGFKLEFPEQDRPSYYIIRPKKEIKNTQVNYISKITLRLYDLNYLSQMGILVEDNSHTLYELSAGLLYYEGNLELTIKLGYEWDGFIFKGIIFYQQPGMQPGIILIHLTSLYVE